MDKQQNSKNNICLYKVFFNKLVRDNIIDQISSQSHNNKVYDLKYRTVRHGEFAMFLRRKLIEELQELHEAIGLHNQIAEMGDVFHILLELASTYQLNWTKLSTIKTEEKINIYDLLSASRQLLRDQKYKDIINTLSRILVSFFNYINTKFKILSVNNLWSILQNKSKKNGAFDKKIVLDYVVIGEQHEYLPLYKTKYKVIDFESTL